MLVKTRTGKESDCVVEAAVTVTECFSSINERLLKHKPIIKKL